VCERCRAKEVTGRAQVVMAHALIATHRHAPCAPQAPSQARLVAAIEVRDLEALREASACRHH